MAGQDLYQVVSTGRTLHAKEPGPVVRDVAKLFSISEPQARRLLLKGWVIKDQLASDQALEFRTRLQKMGLRVEVCPAGRFDNRELIAKIKVAQRRKAQVNATSAAVTEKSRIGTDPFVAAEQPPPAVGRSGEIGPVTDLSADKLEAPSHSLHQYLSAASPLQTESASSQGRIVWGVIKAAVVPSLFLSTLCACIFFAGYGLWQIPLAVWQGTLTGVGLALSFLSVLSALFVGLLLAWPFFCFSPACEIHCHLGNYCPLRARMCGN
ncbi:hypothetical protein ACJJIK_05920 [Microbulbifer sp. ZKSA006]|uniref:hypothetical protein n=1 Tax=Microbulbifer sp. ZKSA006 TaxID=3243390 RepID=UPI004039F41D